MVRKGSSVRVRQRALSDRLWWRGFGGWEGLAAGGVWPPCFGNRGVRRGVDLLVDGAGVQGRPVAVLKVVLVSVRFPLNRKSPTHRRETGPEGPSHDGE